MKQDAVTEQSLREELLELDKFLESPEFRVAKKVTDAEIQQGIRFMIDFEITCDADLWKLLEARGEVRAAQKFTKRFLDRKVEITTLLNSKPQPLDD